MNRGRSFRFDYEPQFRDELRICIFIEREFDFYFCYEYEGWKLKSSPKSFDRLKFPQFVDEFSLSELEELKAS